MKLQPEELALAVFDRGKGGILRVRDGVESIRERGQLVAVAVPDIHLFAEPVEERECAHRCAGVRPHTRAGR